MSLNSDSQTNNLNDTNIPIPPPTQWSVRKKELEKKKREKAQSVKEKPFEPIANIHMDGEEDDENKELNNEFDDDGIDAKTTGIDTELIELGRQLRRFALDNKAKEIAELLATNPHLDVNCVNRSGGTALMGACYRGHIEVVKLLCSISSCNLNALSNRNQTALIYALYKKRTQIVEFLLTQPNIDVSVRTAEHESPYELAFLMRFNVKHQQSIVKLEKSDSEWTIFSGIDDFNAKQKKERERNLSDKRAIVNIAKTGHKYLLSTKSRLEILTELYQAIIPNINNVEIFTDSIKQLILFVIKNTFDAFSEIGIERKHLMTSLKHDFISVFTNQHEFNSDFTIIYCELFKFVSALDKRLKISTKKITAARKFTLGNLIQIPSSIAHTLNMSIDKFILKINLDKQVDLLIQSTGINIFLELVDTLFGSSNNVNNNSNSDSNNNSNSNDVNTSLDNNKVVNNIADNYKSFIAEFFYPSTKYFSTVLFPELIAKDQYRHILKLFMIYPVQFNTFYSISEYISLLIIHREYSLLESLGNLFIEYRLQICEQMLLPQQIVPLGQESQQQQNKENIDEKQATNTLNETGLDTKIINKTKEFLLLWKIEITETITNSMNSAVEYSILSSHLEEARFTEAVEYSQTKPNLIASLNDYFTRFGIDKNNLPEFSTRKLINQQFTKLLRKIQKNNINFQLNNYSNLVIKAVELPEEMKNKVKFIDNVTELTEMRKVLVQQSLQRNCTQHSNNRNITMNDSKTMNNSVSNCFDNSAVCNCIHIGMDIEWRTPRYLSLIQFASESDIYLVDAVVIETDKEYKQALFDLIYELFSNPLICVVGFSFHSDLSQLSRVWPVFAPKLLNNFVDLQSFIARIYSIDTVKANGKDESNNPNAFPMFSLSRLVFELTGQILDKTEQSSNWDRRPLTASQIQYASLDSFILLDLLKKLQLLFKYESQRVACVRSQTDTTINNISIDIEELGNQQKELLYAAGISSNNPIVQRIWRK